MLTREEQDEILRAVRDLVRLEKGMDTKVARQQTTPRLARQAKERAWDNLKDLLKEVG